MKILIVGLGSMGKRRIRNLTALHEKDVIGFDVRNDRCEEVKEKYKIKVFNNLNDALKENPGIMIISTPPDLHMYYAKIAVSNNIHFFTEANVVKNGMIEVINTLKKSSIVGVPSCTLLFHPIVIKIQEILEKENLGKPLTLIHHYGQYLPDWHPWEDIKEYYVSKKETGAGREIVPFELVWITKIFGSIKSTIGNKAKLTNLETDIDDMYNVLLTFENGMLGVLVVDVISRSPFREAKIITENGVILANWTEKTIRYFHHEKGWKSYEVDTGKPEDGYIHGEEPYINEIKGFLNLIKNNEPYPYSFEEDLKNLELLEIIEKSSYEKTVQNINN